MSDVAAVVFDFDGVIVDSEAIHHRAYEIALEPFGVREIPFEVYAEHWSNRGRGLEYAEQEWPGVHGAELKRRKEEIFLELLVEEARLRPGAAQAVDDLAARWPIALATGSQRAAALHVLERFDLRGSFRQIIAREDYDEDKPAPDAYRVACTRLEIPASRSVAIEDSTKGLRAALAAGMPCVVVPNDYTRRGVFDGAACLLEEMTDLSPEIVEGCVG